MEHFALFMEHTKKEKKNNKRYLFIVIGIFLILVGIFVIGYREYSNNKNKLVEQEKIELFFEEEVNDPIEEPKQEEKQEELPKQVEPKKEINYVAILEIPKINLKKEPENSSSLFLFCKCFFSAFNKFCKSCFVCCSNVCKNFSVKFNFSFL